MTTAESLNAVLARHAPAAHALLSPLGKRAVFPKGILAQTAEAKDCRLKATIGQITDGGSRPLPLPVMSEAMGALDARMTFLYSPQEGQARLRQLWAQRQRSLSGGCDVPVSSPIITHGLTQGLGIIADLFADADTEVLVPSPFWGNYKLIFTLRHGAKLRLFPFFSESGFNVQGLKDALDAVRGKKSVLLLNIPGNPTGYTPGQAMIERIAQVVADHDGPQVVVVDDAYQSMLWEPGLARRSLFWELAESVDASRQLVIKLDGATKEFFFFPARIGFLTHTATGPAADALESKIKTLGRATVGSPPGPSQALLVRALECPDLEVQRQANLDILRRRYRALKDALKGLQSGKIFPYPFNSGMFALVGLDPKVSPEEVRRRLIEEHSVGVIAIDSINGLRIAYGATAEADLPGLVRALEQVVG